MPEGDEGSVGKWAPSGYKREGVGEENGVDKVEGLEAALIYRELEQQRPGVRDSVRRFMGTSQDDEMWTSGVEAMEALSVNEEELEGEDSDPDGDSRYLPVST